MSTAILRALRLVSAHLQHHDIASQIILSNSNHIGRNFDVPFKHNTKEKSWVLRCVTMYNKCQCQEAVCLSDCGIHGADPRQEQCKKFLKEVSLLHLHHKRPFIYCLLSRFHKHCRKAQLQ